MKEANNEAEEESSDLNTRDHLNEFGEEEENESEIDQSYPSEMLTNNQQRQQS